jgi:transposase
MEAVVERCAGIDIGKATLKATVRVQGGARRKTVRQVRTFETTTPGLLALRDWLVSEQVTLVGMESTGVFWKPIYYLLEEVVECWLLNARHLKKVPGRKTDVSDSEWIAELVAHGLVRPSFVPPRPIRRLRDLTRYRTALTQDRTREIQRLQGLLEESRPGARCPDCSGSVSPGRSPNPPCASRRNGLSTATAVMRGSVPRGWECSLGSGTG